MGQIKQTAVEGIVADALYRLTHAKPNAIRSKSSVKAMGMQGQLYAILPDLVVRLGRDQSIRIDPPSNVKSIRQAATVADLAALFSSFTSIEDESLGALRRIKREPYPPEQAVDDVATVISHFKNVDKNDVALADKVERYHYTSVEKRSMAQMLNLYIYNEKGLVMDILIHPKETAPAIFVADWVRVVIAHSPHPA